MKKMTIITILMGIILSGVILFSITSTVLAVGTVPSDCQSLSTTNPANDPTCNPSNQNTSCIQYCMARQSGARVIIPQAIGSLRISFKNVHNLSLTIPELNINDLTLDCSGSNCVGHIDINDISVNANTTITMILKESDGSYDLGYRTPNSNDQCGEDNIHRPAGGTYNTVTMTDTLTQATLDNTNYTILSKQCWADPAIGNSDFDFNDFQIVLSGIPQEEPRPEPKCGDRHIDPGEQCDDGNNINGDGCSSTCQEEVVPEDTAGGFFMFIWTTIVNFFTKLF